MTGSVAALRSEYLFSLAHLCHVPAPMAGDLTITDFANYIDSIDAYIRAAPKG